MFGNLLLLVILIAVSTAKFPSNLKKCPAKDKACLKDSAQSAIILLKNGFPEFGMESLGKLKIPPFEIGSGKIVQLIQKYKDGYLYGLDDAKLDEFTLDVDGGKLDASFTNNIIQMNATYDFDGKLLVLPVKGKGSCMLRLEKLKSYIKFNVEKIDKKGVKYLKLTYKSMKHDVEHATFRFENLFDGNHELGDNINQVLSDNWKEIYDEMIGGYDDVYGAVFANYANKLLSQIPLTEMFS